MQFIVYLSEFTGSEQAIDSALNDICSSSKRNNEQREITGALFYHQGTFLQAIEGQKESLEELMQVVFQDERHNNIRVVVDEEVTARSFSEWNMDSFNLAHSHVIEDQTLEKFKQVFLSQMKMDGVTFISLLKSVLLNPSLVKS